MAHETDLSMDGEAIRSLVDDEGFLVLGTVEAGQPPTAEVVPCRVVGERLRFTVGTSSRSHRNIASDPRVCAVVENAQLEFYRMRSVTIHGSALEVGEDSALGEVSYELPMTDVVAFDFSKVRVKH
jgi:nitroimidazol reductase NimA-like FMN-containing flavoprotein (pyridoxamine 5'-phosphate oxidase superfamily)